MTHAKNPPPQDSLAQYLTRGSIAFFGYRGPLPDFLGSHKGTARAYLSKRTPLPKNPSSMRYAHYASLSELREERADVYFLDHEATKVLFAEFPATARYVLVRLVPRVSWLIALPGLLRRLPKRLVSIEGIITLPANGKPTQWLVLKHRLRDTLHTRLSLSEEVGVAGFLAWLKEKQANYVVLRFFEHLPNLGREGGDLDLLVSDEDEQIIKAFLQEHPGTIRVDVWSVSRTSFNDITYYPPPLARAILASAQNGPGGSRIPGTREAFLALAYHVLYHKGLFAGVPTTLAGLSSNPSPENDYAGALARMAAAAGYVTPMNMEALDELLAREGWQPKLDTLAKLAPRNKWVWTRFFSGGNDPEIGLTVFIIKKKAIATGAAKRILDAIHTHPEYRVIREKQLTDEEIPRVAKELRGGVWKGKDGSDEFLPAIAVLALDTVIAKAAKLGMAHHHEDKRVRAFKRSLREQFDTEKTSFTHSADWTHEAWEYVRACWPKEEAALRAEVGEVLADIRLSPLDTLIQRLMGFPRMLTYRYAKAKREARHLLVRWALRV